MAGQELDLIVELINSKFHELNENQKQIEEKRDIQTKAILKEMDSGFNTTNSRIDNLVEQKKIQNGRIGKVEEAQKKTDKNTRVWQFIQKKPYISATIAIVFIAGLIYLANNPSILSLIKSLKFN